MKTNVCEARWEMLIRGVWNGMLETSRVESPSDGKNR